MKYTKIPSDTFKHLQLNAGVLVKSFTPTTATLGTLIGATTGGVTFNATPTFVDFGDDIDNCPKNMKELKKLDSWEAKMSGTFLNDPLKMVHRSSQRKCLHPLSLRVKSKNKTTI